MAKSRKELIKQIDTAVKNLKDELAQRFGASKKPEEQTPQEKYKLHVLEKIFARAESYTESVNKKFAADNKANKDSAEENRKGYGAILTDTLKMFEDEFNMTTGNQPAYIKEAAKEYRETGTNGIGVSKADINPSEDAVMVSALTIYGQLMRQRFCVEQLNELGATAEYAGAAYAVERTLKEGTAIIQPDKLDKAQPTEQVENFEKERNQFKRIFSGLLHRLENNINPELFKLESGATVDLARFFVNVNAQLFNHKNKSKLPTAAFLADLEREAAEAKEKGNEEQLLAVQKRAFAVKIWIEEIVKNLGVALDEYITATRPRVKAVADKFKKDLKVSLKDSLEAGSSVLNMASVLAIADAMQNVNSSDKSDYDLLVSNVARLVTACAELDGMFTSNGWSGSGKKIKNEVDALTSDLQMFTNQFLEKREKVESVVDAFTTLKDAFTEQCKAHDRFPEDLSKAQRDWNGREPVLPMYLENNWFAKTRNILQMSPDGFRAFVNRHWGKMSAGGVVAGTGAVLLAVFVMAVSWPFAIAAALVGIAVGIAAAAFAGRMQDKCCRVQPGLERVDVEGAEFVLGMDLDPNDSPRRDFGSTATAAQALDPEGIELDNMSKMLRNVGEVNLDGVVVDGEDNKPKTPKKEGSKPNSPRASETASTSSSSAASYNPFSFS